MFSNEVCQSQFELESRMATDFVEVTSQGRVYNREEIIKELVGMVPVQVMIENFAARHLAPEVVLVTYRSLVDRLAGGAPAVQIRSSIWRLEDNRWVATYHQATAVAWKLGLSPNNRFSAQYGSERLN